MLQLMQTEAEDIEVRPLRRDEYQQLGELGFFEDEKVELLEGVIVKMSPINEPHNTLEAMLNELLVKAVPQKPMVRPQCSFALSDISEPEPDLAIVDRTGLFASSGALNTEHPSRAYLIVEIAWSSLKKDLGLKARLYAQAGIADYWVVDVDELTITVHRDPSGERYKSVQRFDRFARVPALLVPEVVVCLDELTH